MSMWLVIAIVLGLIKLPIAALMLWLPFRNDDALKAPPPSEDGGSDDDGGLRVRPHGPFPFGTQPRRPRRGPHGGDAIAAPPRVRTTVPASPRLPSRS